MNGPSASDHRRQLQGIKMRAEKTPAHGPRDRSDAIVVTRQPVSGPPRRDRYEPRSGGRWTHIEMEWAGCTWRHVGSEVVEDVAIEGGAE